MAERWQQWMPHDIDSWQGSANIQALSDLGYRAVHNLLLDMWKQDDCAIPFEERELAKRSRVAGRWSECREEVLEYFCDRTDVGKLTHRVLFKKWNEARKVYEKNHPPRTPEEIAAARSAAGKAGAAARWQTDGKSHNSDGKPMAKNALTSTGTETSTGTKDLKPLASTAVAVPADRGKLLGTLPCAGGESYEVREDDLQRDVGLFPGVEVEQEYRNMKAWLLASPKRQKTIRGIRGFMASWLTRAQDRPKGAGNGTFAGKTESSATVGMQRTPPTEDDIAAALETEVQERQKVIAYWRDVRARGRPEQQMPTWVKKELEAA